VAEMLGFQPAGERSFSAKCRSCGQCRAEGRCECEPYWFTGASGPASFSRAFRSAPPCLGPAYTSGGRSWCSARMVEVSLARGQPRPKPGVPTITYVEPQPQRSRQWAHPVGGRALSRRPIVSTHRSQRVHGGASDRVRPSVVEHQDIARLERRRQALRDVGAKAGPRSGPSSTSGATMPVCLRPAMQGCGAPMAERRGDQTCARRLRPERRAI